MGTMANSADPDEMLLSPSGSAFCWNKKTILWESGFELEQYLNIEGFLEKSIKLNLLYISIV